MLASLLQSLQNFDLFALIRGSSPAYLTILALHMLSLAFFGGMVLATDLRLLGIGMRSYPVSEIVDGLRVPKRWGFGLAVISGVLLFGAQAAQYSNTPWFWIKIALLALLVANYLLFRRGVYENAEQLDRARQTPGNAKMTAALSLVLWTGVICAGRGPATIKDIMHSMVDPNGDFIFGSIEQVGDTHGGAREKAPETNADWQDVRQHLAILEEAPDLVKSRRGARPRDRSKNPQSESQPEEIEKALDADRPALLRRARRLQDAAAVAMEAANAKNKDAYFKSIDGIDKACENCHLHYWYPNDKRAQEAAREDGVKDY